MAQISPTLPQYNYMTSEARFPALVAGFGAGKTEAAILRSIFGLISNPGTNRGFYEPTYDLIRVIAWPRFEEILTAMGLPYRLQKTPINQITIPGYGAIIFRSMENPNRIVGYEHADADIDELDTLNKANAGHVWRQVIARNRQTKPTGKPNTIGVTTTPEGFRFVYDAWKKDPQPGYEIIQAPTDSNPHLPDGYIESLRDIYPEQLLTAYLDGQFVNLTQGTVYSGYSRSRCNSQESIEDGEPLYIGCDFNVTQQCAVVYVRRSEEWHAVDEMLDMYDTPEMIRIISERYKDHRVIIYPDASGRARKTVNASTSDIALIEQAGFTVRAKKSNPAIKDRVMATNAAFENGLLYINALKCTGVAESFEQLAYDKNGMPDKNSGLDHAIDAATYPIAYEMPIVKPVAHIPINFSV